MNVFSFALLCTFSLGVSQEYVCINPNKAFCRAPCDECCHDLDHRDCSICIKYACNVSVDLYGIDDYTSYMNYTLIDEIHYQDSSIINLLIFIILGMFILCILSSICYCLDKLFNCLNNSYDHVESSEKEQIIGKV